MTGRAELAASTRRRATAAALLLSATVLTGCGPNGETGTTTGEGGPTTDEVAVCADLRARQNELIRVANEALGELADAPDDAARAAALADGYDLLIRTLREQEPREVPGEPELSERLVDGARRALRELLGERDRFVAEVRAVTQADEHGRAGELQTSLEKVFSELEPPRAAYVEAGLDGVIDADPGCDHVTQRADPAR